MDNNLKNALLQLRDELENFQAFAFGYSNNYMIKMSLKMLEKMDFILSEQYKYENYNSKIIHSNKFKRR